MKRFYAQVEIDDDHGIRLDGRPVRTPGRDILRLPTASLAAAVADEWSRQEGDIDPRRMPLTGLANAAIDRVAPDPASFAANLTYYAATDLVCYRAEGPPALASRQAAAWDPLIGWARDRYGASLVVTAGVSPIAQPPEALERLADAVAARSSFALAGLAPLVTISGSLVIALALADGATGVDAGWQAAELDEAWQAEKWGEDALATQARAARRHDFTAAARFLALADSQNV